MKIRQSYDRLISTMGFPILVRCHLYIESGHGWVCNQVDAVSPLNNGSTYIYTNLFTDSNRISLFRQEYLVSASSISNFDCHTHGGTTEEGNCSYLLPRAAAAGSNSTNKGQIRQVPVDEIAQFLVYRMDVTRSQFRTNTGILVCPVREMWQFKVFTGKEVTPLHEEGNS